MTSSTLIHPHPPLQLRVGRLGCHRHFFLLPPALHTCSAVRRPAPKLIRLSDGLHAAAACGGRVWRGDGGAA